MQCAQIWLKAALMKEYMATFFVTKVELITILTIVIENLAACTYEYYMMR
jgi:hypothetical protein